MKTSRSLKLIITGLIGCGICCLPLLLPAAAGMLGFSVLGFAFSQVLCGIFVLSLAIAIYGLYLSKKKSACHVSAPE